MRIPHIINENTLVEYEPSPESLDLIGEDERKLVSEDFQWNDDHCPPLPDYCVETISKYFERNPLLDELPCENRHYLLEILSTDLPLELVIPIIDDEIYWKRRYDANFGMVTNRKTMSWTWKSLYLERHIQKILEEAQPQYRDEETFNEILDLCAPYIRRVIVTQLQCWKPPLTMDPDEIPDVYPIAHINFVYIFQRLPYITEFDLIFGMNDVFEDFSWRMFKISVDDCRNLGMALLQLGQLKILRIHRSKMEYEHCQALMQNIIRTYTLEEVDLSNCQIGDQGALCVAKILDGHHNLKKLNLSNNYIGQIGAEGIGFTLLSNNCTQLERLNMRLNPLRKGGAMGIMRALVRCNIPEELSMSGCLFDEDTPIKVSQMLKVNVSLKKLDVSGNWFGDDGGEVIIEALESNTTLEWLDVRDTDITQEQDKIIRKLLLRNRTGIVEAEEDIAEEVESEEKVILETDLTKTDDKEEENAKADE